MLEPSPHTLGDQGISQMLAPPTQKNNPIKELRQIKIYAWSELSLLPQRRYLVKGLIDMGCMSVVYGGSNSGKTFFTLDIASHISLNKRWRGHTVKGGNVVYIAAEGGVGIQNRLSAFKQHFNIDEYGALYVIPEAIPLCGENSDLSALLMQLKKIPDIKLIVIDTLSRSFAGGDENSSKDMTQFIQECDVIKKETGAHVLIVHHSGKNGNNGARGHSALKAAVDTEIEIKQDNGIISAVVTKQRDGATDKKISFKLVSYKVGVDEDNDPVSSCALEETSATNSKKKISGQTKRAKDVLVNTLIEKQQVRTVRTGMAPVNCVTLNEFREALKLANISSSDKPDSVNKAISRAIDALNNEAITGSYSNFIWLLDKYDKNENL